MTPDYNIFQSLDKEKLHIFFVGGCGSFGMNFTAYIFKGKLYIVDSGLMFADDHGIGIDAHIPDLNYLMEIFEGPEAYLITHGHEDHVGGLPLILKEWPAPVYTGKWTMEILNDRLAKYGVPVSQVLTFEVADFETTQLPDLKVTWFPITHSIPGCYSLILEFDNESIVHSGDFKIDPNPLYESPPDLEFLKKFAPVTGLITDSTNATKPGRCPGENVTFDALKEAFDTKEKLVVVTTFASNFWRLRTIFDAAEALGKRVCMSGASLHKTLEIGSNLGVFEPNPKVIIEEKRLSEVKRNRLIVIASGSQGEPRSGLRRIVDGDHRFVQMQSGDRIVFSSRVIPGNEKSLNRLLSDCTRKGYEVISSKEFPNIHVSGHGHQDDLRDMYEAVKPKFYFPVHGTHVQLKANRDLFDDSSITVENGHLFSVTGDEVNLVDTLDVEKLFVDSWSRRTMSYENMRSRHKIGDSGLVLVFGTLVGSKYSAETEFIGLPFSSPEETEAKKFILDSVNSLELDSFETLEELNEALRLKVRRYLGGLLTKKPVVICRMLKT